MFLCKDCISPWCNTPHCAEAQQFQPSALSTTKMECRAVQVECGREEVNDGERNKRKTERDETDKEQPTNAQAHFMDDMKME